MIMVMSNALSMIMRINICSEYGPSMSMSTSMIASVGMRTSRDMIMNMSMGIDMNVIML